MIIISRNEQQSNDKNKLKSFPIFFFLCFFTSLFFIITYLFNVHFNEKQDNKFLNI